MEKLDKQDYNLLLNVLLNNNLKLNDKDKASLDLVKLKLLYETNKLKTFYE
tara:strand:+ start:24375 stop:24527 length:153 start_codon:yes stop_codon:yes gene_type:complete